MYFADLGTTLDVSRDEMERLLESDEHGAAHLGDVRNFHVVEIVGPAIVLAFQRTVDGTWAPSRARVTSFRPYGRLVEELEGVVAGSRFFGVHRPDGARARVELFGTHVAPREAPSNVGSWGARCSRGRTTRT